MCVCITKGKKIQSNIYSDLFQTHLFAKKGKINNGIKTDVRGIVFSHFECNPLIAHGTQDTPGLSRFELRQVSS